MRQAQKLDLILAELAEIRRRLEPGNQPAEAGLLWSCAYERTLEMTCCVDASTFVYAIRPIGGGLTKIGWANHPANRIRDIQAMSPVGLELAGLIHGGIDVEQALHRKYAAKRAHGEWFDLGDMADPLGKCPL